MLKQGIPDKKGLRFKSERPDSFSSNDINMHTTESTDCSDDEHYCSKEDYLITFLQQKLMAAE